MDFRYLKHCVRHPKKAYAEYRATEKTIHRKNGKNPDKVYYVIRCNLPECGFFAIYTYVLDHLVYALDRGFVPVLDIEQYQTLYKEDVPVNGTTNPWNYYFEDISDIQPQVCRKMANVIESAVKFPHYKAIYYYADKEKNTLPEKARIAELSSVVRNYIHFKPAIQQQMDAQVRNVLGTGKTLGIHVRGTDMYREGKQHPIPTGETKDFSRIDEIIAKHGIARIFLCSDTESTIELFKAKYHDMVVTTQSVRQKDNTHTGIHKDRSLSNRENHRYKMGLEVLTDMYLLSKCDVLVCGPSNVPFISLVYNNNQYEEVYYFA